MKLRKLLIEGKFDKGMPALTDHCYSCGGEEYQGDTGKLMDFKVEGYRHALCADCFGRMLANGEVDMPMDEAAQDTEQQVLKKTELAKVRADMKQLSANQKQLSLSKKNTKDRMTKRLLTKRGADIGVKRANLGIKAADISTKIKKVGQ